MLFKTKLDLQKFCPVLYVTNVMGEIANNRTICTNPNLNVPISAWNNKGAQGG